MSKAFMWSIVLLALASAAFAAEEQAPKGPEATGGGSGDMTYYYWQVADFGSQKFGDPSPVTQLDKKARLDEKNTVTVTPAPVSGAKGYLVLRSQQVAAPKPRVTVNKKGKDKLYYWLVLRQGWFNTAPSESVEADGCDGEMPDNTVSWDAPPGGPWEYDLLRTSTPHLPLGRAAVSAAYRYGKTSFEDKYPVLSLTRLMMAGNFGTPPFGTGNYLLGRSAGEPVIDKGQPLQNVTVFGGNKQGRDERTFVVDDPPEEFTGAGISRRAFAINSIHRKPTDRYAFGNQSTLHLVQDSISGGLNDCYKIGWYDASAKAKTFFVGLQSDQNAYTHAQHVARFSNINGYACGDKALEVCVIQTHAGNRDGGDEGSEFFSYQVQRHLEIANFTLTADAPRGTTMLPLTREQPQVTLGTGRILLNLSQSSTGQIASIDNDKPIAPGSAERVCIFNGHGTKWTQDMEGGYISLDTDTINGQYRTWYLVQKVVSPIVMHVLAITYYSPSIYMGYAGNVVEHGLEYRGGDKTAGKPAGWKDVAVRKDGLVLEPYMFAPATEVDDPCWSADGKCLKVLPLSSLWKAGDKLQIAPGPQATVHVGNFLFHGNMLPQDQLGGLKFMNDTNRMADGAAIWTVGSHGFRWGFRTELDSSGEGCGFYVGGEKARPDEGCFSMPSDTTGVTFRKVPLTLSGNSAAQRIEFASPATGDKAGEPAMSVSATAVQLHGNTVICGNGNTRGTQKVRGDGKTTAFTVAFPKAYAAVPVVTFSLDAFDKARLAKSETKGFTVEFAEPPADGREIVLSWIAQM